jgi:hypothetical protein
MEIEVKDGPKGRRLWRSSILEFNFHSGSHAAVPFRDFSRSRQTRSDQSKKSAGLETGFFMAKISR